MHNFQVGGNKFLLRLVFLFSFVFGTTFCLSCSEFKDMNVKVNVQLLKAMSNEDIVECLSYFGKEPLADEEGTLIWNKLVKVRGGIQDVADSDLKQLGWVLQHVSATIMSNFTLSEVDTIAALGQYHNLTEDQLQVLAQRVLEDWSGKESSDYTNYDLIALGHIICGFNRSTIEEIHPDSYKDAAVMLSTLRGCPQEQLEALAELAAAPEAFGSPSTWSSSQIKNIGCVINGLSSAQLASIPATGFDTLTPDVVPCISPETLKEMNSEQLSHLTPSAVAALTSQQLSIFNNNQHKAVAEAYEGAMVEKATGSRINFNYFGAIILIWLITQLCH